MRNIKVCKKCENYFIRRTNKETLHCCSYMLTEAYLEDYINATLRFANIECQYKFEHEILKKEI